jgi:hypothetical protein
VKHVTNLILIMVFMVLALGFLVSQYFVLQEENSALWGEVNRLRQQLDLSSSEQSQAQARAEAAEAAFAEQARQAQEFQAEVERLQATIATCDGRTQELTQALGEQTAAREEAQRQLAAQAGSCAVLVPPAPLPHTSRTGANSQLGKGGSAGNPVAAAEPAWADYLPSSTPGRVMTVVLLGMVLMLAGFLGALLLGTQRK